MSSLFFFIYISKSIVDKLISVNRQTQKEMTEKAGKDLSTIAQGIKKLRTQGKITTNWIGIN